MGDPHDELGDPRSPSSNCGRLQLRELLRQPLPPDLCGHIGPRSEENRGEPPTEGRIPCEVHGFSRSPTFSEMPEIDGFCQWILSNAPRGFTGYINHEIPVSTFSEVMSPRFYLGLCLQNSVETHASKKFSASAKPRGQLCSSADASYLMPVVNRIQSQEILGSINHPQLRTPCCFHRALPGV